MADPRHLLYTDFDGKPLATPAPLLGRGLVDDRHLERVPDLAALADDATAHPHDRLYACLALTAWGEERGYRAVVAAAASPPWHGLPQGAADAESQPGAPFGSGVALALPRAPFGVLAAQVGISDASAARKGTEADRRAALRALVRVADREDFDDQLGAAIFTGPPHDLVHDVVAAVRRGL